MAERRPAVADHARSVGVRYRRVARGVALGWATAIGAGFLALRAAVGTGWALVATGVVFFLAYAPAVHVRTRLELATARDPRRVRAALSSVESPLVALHRASASEVTPTEAGARFEFGGLQTVRVRYEASEREPGRIAADLWEAGDRQATYDVAVDRVDGETIVGVRARTARRLSALRYALHRLQARYRRRLLAELGYELRGVDRRVTLR